MQRYEGRVVAITGGARGLGRAMAERFAAEGAAVAVADADGTGAEDAARELMSAHGGQALGDRVDVTVAAEVEAWIARVKQELGRLDVLVNNAGILRDNRVENISDEDWRAVLDVHVTGAFHGMPRRAAADEGAGLRPHPVVLLDVVARQLRPGQLRRREGRDRRPHARRRARGARHGITVNAIAPGLIETQMLASMNGPAREKLTAKIPLGHTGEPADIAAAAAFLCSEEARYVTGVVLDVDGGIGIGSSIR